MKIHTVGMVDGTSSKTGSLPDFPPSDLRYGKQVNGVLQEIQKSPPA